MFRIQSIHLAASWIALLFLTSVAYSQINNTTAVAAATGISKQVAAQEWLGPLSAIALSPFFGLACLSGAASYGPEWLQQRSALIGTNSPLNNPLLFWIMLGLTFATSLPRLTKVSKPFALAVEKLEMYSAVIILISMRFLGGGGLPAEQGVAHSEVVVMTAGLTSLPMDTLLSLIAAINILVVNTIKLAIELLVWLIPFPTVDAILEVANKSLCAALMSLYAYSPWLSAAINLTILAICCLVFFRVKRRIAYVKELILRPMLSSVMGWNLDRDSFSGFLHKRWREFPSKTAFSIFRKGSGDQVELVQRGWTRRLTMTGIIHPSAYRPGVVCDQISISVDGVEVLFDVRKGLEKRTPTEAAYPGISG